MLEQVLLPAFVAGIGVMIVGGVKYYITSVENKVDSVEKKVDKLEASLASFNDRAIQYEDRVADKMMQILPRDECADYRRTNQCMQLIIEKLELIQTQLKKEAK